MGARQILINHPEDILDIDMEEEVILKDIDTPEEYREYTKQAGPGE